MDTQTWSSGSIYIKTLKDMQGAEPTGPTTNQWLIPREYSWQLSAHQMINKTHCKAKYWHFALLFNMLIQLFIWTEKIKMVNVCKLIPQRQNKLQPRIQLINYMYCLIFLSEIICDKSLHIWSRFRTLIHMQSSQLNYKPIHALFKMI